MRKVIFTIFSLVIILGMVYSPAMADAPVVDPRVNGLGDPVEAIAEVIDDGSAIATYFVLLDGDSLASHSAARAEVGKLDASSPESVAYLSYLHETQDAFLASLSPVLGRAATYIYRYDAVLNGFALELSAGQARQIAKMAGVRAVIKDEIRQLDTDTSPGFLGVDTLWTETGSTPGTLSTKGEGMLIGVLDTGINMDHPSFAEVGPVDGYVHVNPFGEDTFVGLCASDPDQYICNNKLVGVWGYTGDSEAITGEDTHAHGSHTASTSAGNALNADYNGLAVSISGMAPHANIIAYDVCDVDGCATSDSTAAVNQAIFDGVDVLNYSIGPSSGPSDPYSDPVELAMLDAVASGILTATSAGNSGPAASTVYKAPAWDIVVANSSHNRSFGVNVIVDVNPTAGDSFELTGVVGTGPVYGPITSSLKWAGPDYVEGCNTTPFPADYFDGFIALISRGTCGFAEKVANATAAGADAVVIYNNRQGPAIVMGALETTTIPAVMVDQADGLAAIEYLTVTHTGEDVTIELTEDFVRRVSDDWADIIDSQTSRGPYLLHDILEPEVAAPGTNIMAAYNTPVDTNPFGEVNLDDEVEIDLMSGTSMASPHVAGSALLLMDLFPTWTPLEIKSALMMTADKSTMLKDNGATPADIFDVGNGRIDLTKAALTGLVMNETRANFVAADPAEDGDVKTLNIPSYQDSQCIGNCSFTRTFKNVADVETDYTVAIEKSANVLIDVTPSTFTIPVGGTQVVTVDIDVSAATIGTWEFAYVSLETDDTFTTGETISDVRLPVAVMVDAGNLPALVEQTVGRDAGGVVLDGLYSIEITDMTFEIAGLTEADIFDFQLDPDPTNGDAYDDLSQVWYTSFTVPATARLVMEILETSAADLDMFFGIGAVPSKASERGVAATASALEYLSFVGVPEGTYWVLVENWAGAPADDIKLAVGIVPGADAGNFDVDGPAAVPAGDFFELELTWDEPAMEAGSAWYGLFTVGSDGTTREIGDIGLTEVNIYRTYDDVIKEASTDAAGLGDTVTYAITIAPNQSEEDLNYVIEDILPAGVTYVPGSVDTAGSDTDATYDAGTNSINWVGTVPVVEYTYLASTPENNPDYCDTPFGGGYLDLKPLGVNPSTGISGDTISWSYNTLGVGTQYYGETIPTKPTFNDDGHFYMYPTTAYPADFWMWVEQQFPDSTIPNGIVAPFMRDMYIVAEAGNKGVSAASWGSGGILWAIEFDDIEDYWTSASMDYEVFAWRELDPTVGWPDIVFAYDNVMGDWEEAIGGPWGSVGLENITGTVGTDVAFNNWTPESGDIVCLDYAAIGVEPVVITFDVTVDDVDDASITNTLSHEADGFGMREEEASATFDVNLTLTDLDLYSSLNEIAWDMVPGSFEEGFALLMDPMELFYYLDADNIVANRDLADGEYPFYLDQTDLPTGFMPFWDAKGVNAGASGDWEEVMYQIITGVEPMFYLKVDGTDYDLIDGLLYLASGGTEEETLRVNGDYPIGEYTFNGEVEDILGRTDDVAVDIEFLAPFELTDLDLYSSIDEVAWEMVSGEFDTGFALPLDPVNLFYYLDTDNLVANRAVGDGFYPFYLDQADLPAGFMAYWNAKGVNAGASSGWEAAMYQIITGVEPMFFLKVDGMSYDLIDGLQYLASMGTLEATLRVSGDYPFGTYTFNGDVEDEFGYSDDVAVDITFNDTPMAYDQTLTTVEDTALPITLTADDGFPGDPFVWFVYQPTHGVLTGMAPDLIYTPDADYYGPDSFTFYVSDGFNISNTATITIDVTPEDDSPVAVDDNYTTPMSTTLMIAAPGVMANDYLVDLDEITMVILVSGTQHGTVQLFGDGSFVYIPVPGYIGMDSFVYNVLSLPTRSVIDQATVYIDVTAYIYYIPFIVK